MADRGKRVRRAFRRLARARRADDAAFHGVALEVLCRVFDDGADVRYDKWLAWYNPEQWLHPARALGAFIRRELDAGRGRKARG